MSSTLVQGLTIRSRVHRDQVQAARGDNEQGLERNAGKKQYVIKPRVCVRFGREGNRAGEKRRGSGAVATTSATLSSRRPRQRLTSGPHLRWIVARPLTQARPLALAAETATGEKEREREKERSQRRTAAKCTRRLKNCFVLLLLLRLARGDDRDYSGAGHRGQSFLNVQRGAKLLDGRSIADTCSLIVADTRDSRIIRGLTIAKIGREIVGGGYFTNTKAWFKYRLSESWEFADELKFWWIEENKRAIFLYSCFVFISKLDFN